MRTRFDWIDLLVAATGMKLVYLLAWALVP